MANLFAVSASTAVIWVKCRRRTGLRSSRRCGTSARSGSRGARHRRAACRCNRAAPRSRGCVGRARRDATAFGRCREAAVPEPRRGAEAPFRHRPALRSKSAHGASPARLSASEHACCRQFCHPAPRITRGRGVARQQINVLRRRASKRPHLNNTDRFLFVWAGDDERKGYAAELTNC